MRIYMAQDPENGRITMQDVPFGESSFPRGARGRGWPQRTGELDDEVWRKLIAAELTPDEQDEVHQDAWADGTLGA